MNALRIIYKGLRFSLLAAIVLTLVACSKVTQENYNKIQTGMTEQQVVQILGEPTKSESVDFVGLSGTSSVWQHGDIAITIQFINNEVQVKSLSKSGSSSHSSTKNSTK